MILKFSKKATNLHKKKRNSPFFNKFKWFLCNFENKICHLPTTSKYKWRVFFFRELHTVSELKCFLEYSDKNKLNGIMLLRLLTTYCLIEDLIYLFRTFLKWISILFCDVLSYKWINRWSIISSFSFVSMYVLFW